MNRRTLLAFAALAAIATPAYAVQLDEPAGEVVLTISGAIDADGRNSVDFDMDMIEAMPKQVFSTTAPWFDEATEFEGVLMRDLLASVGAEGDTVVAVALNDYVSEIPFSDFVEHEAILAYKINGEYMPIADKGPFFLVYPFDSDPELQSQMYYQRSVWQIRSLEVE